MDAVGGEVAHHVPRLAAILVAQDLGVAADARRQGRDAVPRRAEERASHPSCWGPRNGPQTPSARRAPAEPGRASITRARPSTDPQTPSARPGPAGPAP